MIDTSISKEPQGFDLAKFFKAPDEFNTEDFVSLLSGFNRFQLGTIANPYHFRSWWNSIQALPKDNYTKRAVLYHRALHYLPGSYKLWHSFLKESRKFVKQFNPLDNQEHYEIVNDLFERSLVYMNKMPKIWLDYAKFLSKQHLITETRKVYDRALISLPVT